VLGMFQAPTWFLSPAPASREARGHSLSHHREVLVQRPRAMLYPSTVAFRTQTLHQKVQERCSNTVPECLSPHPSTQVLLSLQSWSKPLPSLEIAPSAPGPSTALPGNLDQAFSKLLRLHEYYPRRHSEHVWK
jgi:hypothetical protein